MTVPPPTPLADIAAPATTEERALVRIAKEEAIASREAVAKLRQRDHMIYRMHDRGEGLTQRRIADLLSLGRNQAGERPLSENAVQRAIRVRRTADEVAK